MSESKLFIGNNLILQDQKPVNGGYITLDGEEFYVIRNYDSMLPFFMSLASDSDHWMFISSTGGLSAGRINPESALFPYYTDDKLQESSENTGNKTIFRVVAKGGKYLWEPFSDRNAGIYNTERNIYKNPVGNKIIFEEVNHDLNLTFRYSWNNSDRFGWIKKSTLINNASSSLRVELIDGLQNLLPYGVDRFMQNQFSTLLDGYKKSELVKESALGLFRLESIPVDKAEPSEALKVATVWTCGLVNSGFMVSSRQLDRFRKGGDIIQEEESKGVKGAFFANSNLELASGESRTWYFIAEVNQDAVKVNNLISYIAHAKDKQSDIERSIKDGTVNLRNLVADADGIQQSADKLVAARHFSNVLFNVMRGGVFDDGYKIDKADFLKHLKKFNHRLREKYDDIFKRLPEKIFYEDLKKAICKDGDKDLQRLFLEYLPLTFSRRHGDPSRPWNLFSINIKDPDDHKILSYQGNWRDIFQNWEALAMSYPGFINGMIAKFLNATSADGYNPYRITRDGIDWEVPEPDNPFSNIGYWGDHQIIYLLKLFEISEKYFPGRLQDWINDKIFAFANIPYRIKPYEKIVANPHDSIDFDRKAHEEIEEIVANTGSDGKLVLNASGEVFKVNLTEKILSPLLCKLSNFIPEAGIWMNTLRPEWNDANNALVGNGVSMVTLYYMRRFLNFAIDLIESSKESSLELTAEMANFLNSINEALISNRPKLVTGFNDIQRRSLTDQLGTAGSEFRARVYNGLSGQITKVKRELIVDFLKISRDYIDQSVEVNRRADRLYNAYNLIIIRENELRIRNLYEMLEGQVAVLSSGKLTPGEVVDVLDALKTSKLYRADQESYILYPDKKLPGFLEKNIVPAGAVSSSPLLKRLVESGNTAIIAKDEKGQYHFNGSFRNASYLKAALENLKTAGFSGITGEDINQVTGIFESIFDHQSFTGRSGTFYKYEGLGSIYWHMVSKLLLAIAENFDKARESGASADILHRLVEHYLLVQKGIGVHKTPDKYGAFPTDPYSHTPGMAGVQQPGMTGQVKEDIISRFFELGLKIYKGQIYFNPVLLKRSEFIEPQGTDNQYSKSLYLSFTFCKIPVTYLLDNSDGIDMIFKNADPVHFNSYAIDKERSILVFNRDENIAGIHVHLNPSLLLNS